MLWPPIPFPATSNSWSPTHGAGALAITESSMTYTKKKGTSWSRPLNAARRAPTNHNPTCSEDEEEFDEPGYSCPVCPRSFSFFSSLNDHMAQSDRKSVV